MRVFTRCYTTPPRGAGSVYSPGSEQGNGANLPSFDRHGRQDHPVRGREPRHFHDYGKLLLAFVALWAYMQLSQLIIIWSGNLPEEVTFYINRTRGAWK